MTQHEILQIALEQSAIDMNCSPRDFGAGEPRVFLSREDPRARIYHAQPFPLQLVSYGAAVVASTRPELRRTVYGYLAGQDPVRALEAPSLVTLQEQSGLVLTEIAQRYLPRIDALHDVPSALPIRRLRREEWAPLYRAEFSNALSRSRPQSDEIVLAAFDGEEVVGLAGASRDCASMMQIGIDVLPPYRKRGLASSLVSRLALDILSQGAVPFYTTAISNVASARVARACGFDPAWVEISFADRD